VRQKECVRNAKRKIRRKDKVSLCHSAFETDE
jgi:hypothetical protein